MTKNIGTSDRILRGVLSLILFVLAWWFSSWIFLAIALFTLYEALASWCVLYEILGKNSCPISTKKKK